MRCLALLSFLAAVVVGGALAQKSSKSSLATCGPNPRIGDSCALQPAAFCDETCSQLLICVNGVILGMFQCPCVWDENQQWAKCDDHLDDPTSLPAGLVDDAGSLAPPMPPISGICGLPREPDEKCPTIGQVKGFLFCNNNCTMVLECNADGPDGIMELKEKCDEEDPDGFCASDPHQKLGQGVKCVKEGDDDDEDDDPWDEDPDAVLLPVPEDSGSEFQSCGAVPPNMYDNMDCVPDASKEGDTACVWAHSSGIKCLGGKWVHARCHTDKDYRCSCKSPGNAVCVILHNSQPVSEQPLIPDQPDEYLP